LQAINELAQQRYGRKPGERTCPSKSTIRNFSKSTRAIVTEA